MPTLSRLVTASSDDAFQNGIAAVGRTFTDNTAVNTSASAHAPGQNGNFCSLGVRFLNVTIPQGSTINSASISLESNENFTFNSSVVSLTISCQAADNPGTFNATTGDLNATSRPRTTAYSTWVLTGGVVTTTGVRDSVDVKAPLQEVVNRSGFASGNAVGFLFDCASGTNDSHDVRTYDFGSSNAPQLTVDYTPPGGGASLVAVLGLPRRESTWPGLRM